MTMELPGGMPQGRKGESMYRRVIHEKRCPVCGKRFDTTNTRTMYCSEQCKKRKAKNPRPKVDKLTETAKEARKLGMSYGAYVARREAGARG